VTFRDDFDGHDLDRSVWIPHYLPQWSSRAESAATYEVTASEVRLSIPPEQGLWCPVEHEEPLRVSGIQSGNRLPTDSASRAEPEDSGRAMIWIQPSTFTPFAAE